MKLVDHWRTVMVRSASNWVATVLGFLVGALAQTYMAAFAVIGFLPWPRVQIIAAGIIGAIVIGGPIVLARLVEQPKLQAKIKEKRNADQPK